MLNMKWKVFQYSYSNKVTKSSLKMSKLYQILDFFNLNYVYSLKANPDSLAFSREKLLAPQWSVEFIEDKKMAAKSPV